MEIHEHTEEHAKSNVFENAVTAADLQEFLSQTINVIGTDSVFVGPISEHNKPIEVSDTNQFYLAHNNESCIVVHDLTECGFGMLSVRPGEVCILSNSNGVWKSYSSLENHQ